MESTKARLCSFSDLKEGDVVKASSDPPIAAYLVNGEVFATSNICTHGNSELSDGYLDGDRIECGLHLAQFCIRTGAPGAPASVPLATYNVEVIDGDVYVDLPAQRI